MKLTKICMAALSAACLLTSCLGEGTTTVTQTLPGVVSIASDGKVIIETSWGKIYAPEFMKLIDDCVLVQFTYDSKDPQNANEKQNGYAYVTNTAAAAVKDFYVSPYPSDTTKLMENEIPLKAAIAYSGGYGGGFIAYLKNYLFFDSTYEGMDKQVNDWSLEVDADQEPVVGDNGNNVYTLFLRAIKRQNGQTPSSNYLEVNAYNMDNTITRFQAKEKAAGKESFDLKVCFINEIKEDSTFTWDYSMLQQFPAATAEDSSSNKMQ